MILEIDHVLVKHHILTAQFLCDLPNCLGKCCLVGDSGAPVTRREIQDIERNFQQISPFLKPEGRQAITEGGIAYEDFDGDEVLTLISGRECAFSFNEGPVYKCGIEAAFDHGRSDFRKPLSCHLYPVRVESYQGKDLLSYERNVICEAGRKLGRREKLPLYMFLKKALTRAYGEEWFDKLEYAAKNLQDR